MSEHKGWLSNFDKELIQTVFKLKVELENGKIVSKDFSVDLSIDYDLIEEHLAETPAMFAFLSSMLSEQKYACAKIERMIARRRAKIIENANEEALSAGLKMHKYILDELVEADDEILKHQSRLMLAQRSLGKLYGLVDAMRIKNDNLRTLAGFKKEEMRHS